MTKTLEFKISIDDFDAGLSKRLADARKAVSAIEAEIIQAYKGSARAKAAYDLSGFGNYGSKYSPITRIQAGNIVTSINMDIDDDNVASPRPTLYLAEKTVNMLLSGKLLNDEQKKALLKQIGFDVNSLGIPS